MGSQRAGHDLATFTFRLKDTKDTEKLKVMHNIGMEGKKKTLLEN